MAKGKKTCRILKEIRRQIAEANDIEYVVEECQYKGDCLGTCPKCEAEVRYLERQLQQRQLLGKAVMLAGVSSSLLTLSSCKSDNRTQGEAPLEDTSISMMEKSPVMRPVFTGELEPYDGDTTKIVKKRVKFTAPLIKEEEDKVLPKKTRKHLVSETKDSDVIMGDFSNVLSDNVHDENVVYDVVEEMPSFPGGTAAMMSFISKNLKAPEPDDSCYHTRTIANFIVNEDGSISDVKIVRSCCQKFGEALVNLILSMPKWNPGKHKGMAVKCKYTFPLAIDFK